MGGERIAARAVDDMSADQSGKCREGGGEMLVHGKK